MWLVGSCLKEETRLQSKILICQGGNEFKLGHYLGTDGDTKAQVLETMGRKWSRPRGHRAYLRLRVQSRVSDRNR
jgi:hypothetical protein